MKYKLLISGIDEEWKEIEADNGREAIELALGKYWDEQLLGTDDPNDFDSLVFIKSQVGNIKEFTVKAEWAVRFLVSEVKE